MKGGARCRGLTKLLERRLFSDGTCAWRGTGSRATKRWKGVDAGRRRGRAVDSQLTRLVNAGKTLPSRGNYSLSNLVLATLAHNDLEPLVSQRAVCDERLRVATAIDLLCLCRATSTLVVVEVKCGYESNHHAAFVGDDDGQCRMAFPLRTLKDTPTNRHLVQLACTNELFRKGFVDAERLQSLGVDPRARTPLLLYADDEASELIALPEWHRRRARVCLQNLTLPRS